MITSDQLAELRRLHEAATPGPWKHFQDHGYVVNDDQGQRRTSFPYACLATTLPNEANAALIAAAVNALPGLLDRIAELEAEVARVPARDSEIERQLVATRNRLTRGLAELHYVPHSEACGHPHGYSVLHIPDWEAKQWIAEIEEALGK